MAAPRFVLDLLAPLCVGKGQDELLWHVAAGLLISAGANVKAVQRQLGHADAAMTLNSYAALWEDGLDSVADAKDKTLNAQRG